MYKEQNYLTCLQKVSMHGALKTGKTLKTKLNYLQNKDKKIKKTEPG